MTIQNLVFLLICCLTNIDGLDRDGWPGYVHYPALNGWLKLHQESTDYQAARVLCHMEGALLVSQWNSNFIALIEILQTSAHAMHSGTQITFADGVFEYHNGQPSISLEPSSSERCVKLFPNGTTGEIDCQQRLPYVCYAPMPACGQATLGYTYANLTGHCYKFHSDEKYWTDAFEACQEEGAHLAVANSDAEARLLTQLFPDNSSIHLAAIGFYYWKQTDSWRTIHGTTIQQAGFAKWRDLEPKNVEEFNRGFLDREGTLSSYGKLSAMPYICEKISAHNLA